MALIYHIAAVSDWEQAQITGEYRISTRGQSLDEVGFIHSSTNQQVASVANAFYRNDDGLVLLVIDVARVRPEIRYEQVPGSDDPFPHIYGPLNTDAVVQVLPFEPGTDGLFSFSASQD